MTKEKEKGTVKKIVVFMGSPRKDGFTAKMVQEVIKGAESAGAQIKFYDLNDRGVRGCQSCFYCRTHEGCAAKDYLQPMYEDLKDCEGVVLGSPIYYYQITGQAKILIDRLFPMVEGEDFKPRYPGKKAVTLFSQGFPKKDAFKSGIDFVSQVFGGFGWDVVETLVCAGTDGPEAFTDELRKQAYEAGKMLAK